MGARALGVLGGVPRSLSPAPQKAANAPFSFVLTRARSRCSPISSWLYPASFTSPLPSHAPFQRARKTRCPRLLFLVGRSGHSERASRFPGMSAKSKQKCHCGDFVQPDWGWPGHGSGEGQPQCMAVLLASQIIFLDMPDPVRPRGASLPFKSEVMSRKQPPPRVPRCHSQGPRRGLV